MNTSSKYAMTLVMVIGVAAIMTAAAVTTFTFSAYAGKDNGHSNGTPGEGRERPACQGKQ